MTAKIFINSHRKILNNASLPNPAIRAFHQSLPLYTPSPLLSLSEVAREIGIKHVLLKDESTRLGLAAFKISGARWTTVKASLKRLGLDTEDITSKEPNTGISLKRLGSAARSAGLTLYAATDGSHGRAVARRAKYLGIQAQIFDPVMLDEEAIGKI